MRRIVSRRVSRLVSRSVIGLVAATGILLPACSDQPTETRPPAEAVPPPAAVTAPTSCTLTDLVNAISQLLPRGPLRTSVIALVSRIPTRLQDRIKLAARQLIFPIEDFVFRAFYAGKLAGGRSAATFDKVIAFDNLLRCYVGLPLLNVPAATSGSDLVVGVVFPNSPTTTLATPSAHAAVTIPAGAAPSATTIAIRILPDQPPPLLTSFDQYPLFYEFSGSTATGPVTFTQDVIAGVCLRENFDLNPAALRLAHNVGTNFGAVEVLPPAGPAPGLNCNDLGGSAFRRAPGGAASGVFAWGGWTRLERTLTPVAHVLLPQELHAAAVALATSGTTGKTRRFSPFGSVDTTSNPASLGANSATTQSADPGTPVTAPPSVLVQSANGTPILNVPVVFAVSNGGGTVNGGSSATVLTNASGVASLTTWVLGPNPGSNTVSATPPAIARSSGPNTAPYRPAAAFNPLSLPFTAQASGQEPPPSPGTDVAVFNDINVFDNFAAQDPSNVRLFKNLVNFTTVGPRGSATGVLIHLGHGSVCVNECPSVWTTFVSTMTGEGYSVTYGNDETALLTTLGSNVKVVILAVPTQPYSTAEVNSLKAFAGQGGRIVFVGEHEGYYGAAGIAVENVFLDNMGAEMQNTGGAVDCNYNVVPQSSLRAHQITAGLTQLTIACASVVDPGPNDYALFYDLSGEFVLGAVAKVSLTPLALTAARAPGAMSVTGRSARVQPEARSNDPVGRGMKAWLPARRSR